MWKRSFRARPPSKFDSRRCENEAFLRDFPQILKVEDVRIKLSCWRKWQMWKQLSCETSLKIWKLKVWNVKTKLSCETSLKIWKWKMWKRSFRARTPSKFELPNCENEAWTGSSTARPVRPWSRFKRACFKTVRRTSFPIHLPGQFYPAKHSIWCIRSLSKTHFVRDFPQEVASSMDHSQKGCWMGSKLMLNNRKTFQECKSWPRPFLSTSKVCQPNFLWLRGALCLRNLSLTWALVCVGFTVLHIVAFRNLTSDWPLVLNRMNCSKTCAPFRYF